MPESFLWLVNFSGSVFTLGTSKKKFKQLENTWDDSLLVMKLNASHWCSWALGNNNRIYVYVLSSDEPIIVPETTYENQRWNPINNTFSKNAMWRTDRYAWSDETGVLDKPKESFHLPSTYWVWEGDWGIDENLRGEVIGREGWQYAVDFPREYFTEKHWNSFVRRRKWIRFRRFSATNVWVKISDDDVVKNNERFIDVSVGGFLLPSQPVGFLSVWAITHVGKVYTRTNVNQYNPEGDSWQHLDSHETKGLINISVGATYLIWAINWQGQAMVRTDITVNTIYGSGWKLVEYPNDNTRLSQVSVGRNAVWALSRDGQIWFRKGTCGEDNFWNEKSATGTSWVHMVGQMSQITVSSNDQVFAIDSSYKIIYFRTAITRSDLTGKTWQPIHLVEDFTSLLRQGLIGEGDVCYCGDPGHICSLHGNKKYRTSSNASSCSNMSTANTDDASVDTLSRYAVSAPMPPAWQSTYFQPSAAAQSGADMSSIISSSSEVASNEDFLSLNTCHEAACFNDVQISPELSISQCNASLNAKTPIQDTSWFQTEFPCDTKFTISGETDGPGAQFDIQSLSSAKHGASLSNNNQSHDHQISTPQHSDPIKDENIEESLLNPLVINCNTLSPAKFEDKSELQNNACHITFPQGGNTSDNNNPETVNVSKPLLDSITINTESINAYAVGQQALSSELFISNTCTTSKLSLAEKSSEDCVDYGIISSLQSKDPVSLFYDESNHSTFPTETDSLHSSVHLDKYSSNVVKSNHLKSIPIFMEQELNEQDNHFSSMESDHIIDFVSLTGSDAENSYTKNVHSCENTNEVHTSDSLYCSALDHCELFQDTQTGSDDNLFEGIDSRNVGTQLTLLSPSTIENISTSLNLPEEDSPMCTVSIKPAKNLSLAQPRLCWKWLDATSCVIDDPLTVEWLTTKEVENIKKVVKISQSLRNTILKKLWERNQREVQNYTNIELAITNTTWVKKASMQMLHYSRDKYWLPCIVEFEQGISNSTEGCLTVHYQYRKSHKNVQIPLSEMTCVKMSSDPDHTSCFLVYTSLTTIIHQPLMLKAVSESEAEEWIGYLSAANARAWNMNSPISPGSIWSCTFTGDVFVAPAEVTNRKPFDMCWGHHGGHMAFIETGPSGVTWGVGFDKMPYVYNKGYGGAVTGATLRMSENIQKIVDSYHVYVYENQKSYLLFGWRDKGVLSGDFHWMSETGRRLTGKEDVKLLSSKWQWTSDWSIDLNVVGGVDAEGWQYANYFEGPFHKHRQLGEHYRRRRWVRKCRINLYGPWQTAGYLGLIDLSIQIDPVLSKTDFIVMWAVGANGNVLLRQGVTIDNPLGECWIHVATDLDKPFKSISVGGRYRVWGIASDGSAWYRSGVTQKHHAGNCWLQVVPPPPGNHLLHQVSAGATIVWAVDTGDNLWRRENITATFPEGTGWEFVSSRVKRVSVGPKDQVWVVTDSNFCKAKHGPGVIYNRIGITDERPSGTDWEVVIGSGWAQVSVRGVYTDVSLYSAATTSEDTWD
ncbi:tectonin beta-propeller repeat-containing protein 1-like isoform X1 [Biomphalaria glabrata]|uniref:Tectonin beta-propeller repeat-containing protein 1 n=2 Tax=Biomphalaria glabrata TaxID=6526 RepID=A0A9W2ZMX7_BIOGL|nr:tectonin beta-propeller repeat-containing protein 1-like isoform X1 [Biomphalaria glabrata]XP_055876281.1 tectonin beta-propeller repeat-containing protein 1-like isoform X1 [Biomphalaria glabrata]XP_055876282.1 tectonin beta-propeller repeat-containing protein 1-like isoform X1 [Biomphalaria glabrata]XP_055876283.1 tectonin beta-propeller repeat-containing protein 1-like isoform X1 [Biomphalaria glabrata]